MKLRRTPATIRRASDLPGARYRIGDHSFTFAAAHQLDGLPDGHKARRVHGHTWTVEVVLADATLRGPGFVADYAELKPVGEYLKRTLDHRDLSELFDFQTTTDLLAQHFDGWFVAAMAPELGKQLEGVRVWHSPPPHTELQAGAHRFTFAAAHHLDGLPDGHKCGRLHLATLDTEPVATAVIDLLASTADPYLRSGDAITDTLLTAAIRTDLVATILDPALNTATPRIVIEDRGIHTMQSYAIASLLRDHRAPLDAALSWVQTLTTMAGPRPGLALWLRLPVDDAVQRASQRSGPSPLPEHRSYLHWADHAYTELAHHDPQLTIVDVTSGDPEHVHHTIHQIISEHTRSTDTAVGQCVGLPHRAEDRS